MPPMIETLTRHPEKGFPGAESFLFWRGIMLLQYWRSFDDLDRFARSPADPHLEAWDRFNRAVGNRETARLRLNRPDEGAPVDSY
jgi:hypothetical protein